MMIINSTSFRIAYQEYLGVFYKVDPNEATFYHLSLPPVQGFVCFLCGNQAPLSISNYNRSYKTSSQVLCVINTTHTQCPACEVIFYYFELGDIEALWAAERQMLDAKYKEAIELII